jgi:hypothetical protein
MRLQVEHLVGCHLIEDTLEACIVGSVQKKLLPEAVGKLGLLVLFLYLSANDFARVCGGHTR